MAERTVPHEPAVPDVTHMSEDDFRAQHLATYTRFLGLTKWTVIVVAVILALMGLLLT